MFESAIIEKIIGYHFNDVSLLQRAFTHSSFSEYSYERLEFLGDSILGAVVAEYLFSNYKDYDQGKLTLIRANVVDKPPLVKVIKSLKLNDYMLLGKGEKQNKLQDSNKLCGDLYEAIIGAIYIDVEQAIKDGIDIMGYNGYSRAREFILSNLEQTIIKMAQNYSTLIDYKSKLYDYCQKNRIVVEFKSSQTGSSNNAIHNVKLYLDGVEVSSASGTRIKNAEQTASNLALKKLEINL